MTKADWTPDSQPTGEADPLSATGMFLSALGKESSQPQKPKEESPAQPVAALDAKQAQWPLEQVLTPSPKAAPATPAPVEGAQGSPGEFTKMFRAPEPLRAEPPRSPAAAPPAQPSEARQVPPPAPGEFTRIFVKQVEAKPADRVPAPPVRIVPEPPLATSPAPGAPRLKGFSSGASDSASAEGGFTQFFQPRPSTPAPAASPAARVQPYTPPTPSAAAPVDEFKWSRQPEFSAADSHVGSGAGSAGVTDLFASLAPTGQPQQNVKAEAVKGQTFEPLPSYTPASPAEPSTGEAGSVTRLIQRLSEGTRPAPLVEPPPETAEVTAQSTGSGPGEFTRMISAATTRSAAGAPAPVAPRAAPAPFAAPAIPPPPAMPAAPKPMAPPPPAAFQVPKAEPPKAPAFAPPTVPAPKSKLEEMVPILLVVNTFLLIVLIVVQIFALKAR